MFGILEAKPRVQDSSIRNGSSPSPKPEVKPSRRRDKPQLSCSTCRQKKLKCDRVKPCSNCIKRGLPDSCDFAKQTSRPRPSNVQDRVQQLEEIVRSLLNSQSSLGGSNSTAGASPFTDGTTTGTPDGSFTASAPSPNNQTESQKQEASQGKFTNTSEQVKFVGSDHWESILEDITDLKMDLENTSTTERTEYRPRILFGLNRVSRSEILSSIPPRPVCDMLISRFSRTLDMASMMVHLPKFLREYDKMFQTPDETPLM
ncbi:hypothetical protein DL98DRAFT_595443 [Cadophora sp. DSE1049]|nr:hypothetical protein DL98DRAFT_595443 [Cadophora sp. DSE1049]